MCSNKAVSCSSRAGFLVSSCWSWFVPIVLSTLETYKACVHLVQPLYHWESQLTSLIRSLRILHTRFKTQPWKVVPAAGPYVNIQEIPEDHDSILWHDDDTAAKVKAYLHIGYEASRLTVEEYDGYVKRIAHKLWHVNRPRTVRCDPSPLAEEARSNFLP